MERCKHYTLDCGQEERTCEGCAYYEKSADEIFDSMGLIKEEDLNYIIYSNKEIQYFELIFNKNLKVITYQGFNALRPIDIKAINKKMEELRWE